MRDERGARWFDDLRADVLYTVKGMRRNPAFILAATLTLGLGIGVNGIVFGYVNTIMFRPVPALVPEELAALFTRDTRTGNTGSLGYDDFVDFRDRSGAFAGLAAMAGAPVNLVVPQATGNSAGDMVWAEIVTEDFFSVLGARPAVGRFFTAAEAPQGGNPFVVLSYNAWQRRFQTDPNVVGRVVRINGGEFVVTGVAPRGFKGMRLLGFWPEVWVPIGMQPVAQPGATRLLHGRGGGPLMVFVCQHVRATSRAGRIGHAPFSRDAGRRFGASIQRALPSGHDQGKDGGRAGGGNRVSGRTRLVSASRIGRGGPQEDPAALTVSRLSWRPLIPSSPP